jgi:hypothetical protein
LGQLCFAAVVVVFLPEVGVEDMLSAELAGNMLFAGFVKTAGNWLWCDGMMKVGLGCLDGFAEKMSYADLARGGIDDAAFLAGEGCQ